MIVLQEGFHGLPTLIGSCILYAVQYSKPWAARVSSETSFTSKQPKLEPKLVSALSETKRLFRLFRFFTKTASFGISIEPKQKKNNQNVGLYLLLTTFDVCAEWTLQYNHLVINYIDCSDNHRSVGNKCSYLFLSYHHFFYGVRYLQCEKTTIQKNTVLFLY